MVIDEESWEEKGDMVYYGQILAECDYGHQIIWQLSARKWYN